MEILPNELRIGNYVNYKCSVIIIDTIYYDSVNIDLTNCDGIDINLLKPIPITEEVLLKCGFEKEGVFHFWIKHLLIWNPSEGLFVHDKTGVQIKYLHQLQNLYYCFTGKELEFKI